MGAGKFIVFEGLDGSGLTTQARLLHERLLEMRVPCNRSAEPTKGPIGAILRQYLGHRLGLDHRTVASLFAADRLDHLFNPVDGIAKRIADGVIEISERYLFSSLAYQGVSLDIDWLLALNKLAIIPDIVIFLEIPAAASYDRISRRQTSDDVFESLGQLERVALNFDIAFRRFEKRTEVLRINGALSAKEVAEEVWLKLGPLLLEGQSGVLPLWERRPSSSEPHR